MNQGFSLTEVVCALMLLAGGVLMIKQEWNIQHAYQEFNTEQAAYAALDDAVEWLKADLQPPQSMEPFYFKTALQNSSLVCSIYWQSLHRKVERSIYLVNLNRIQGEFPA